MDPRFEAAHPREPSGKFRPTLKSEPEVSLIPVQADPDPGTIASLEGLADDLVSAEGADPVSPCLARVRSVAFFASELSRQCINAAKKQALSTGRPNEAVTVALRVVTPVPRAIMALGDDVAAALERIRLARSMLADAAAAMGANGNGGLKGVDGRLAAMEVFLSSGAADRAA